MLELYVLGLLSDEERAGIVTALSEYPELRQELAAIEAALEVYGKTAAIAPAANVKDRVMRDVQDSLPESVRKNPRGSGRGGQGLWSIIAILATLGLIVSLFFLNQRNRELKSVTSDNNTALDSCAQQNAILGQRVELLEKLLAPGSQIIPLQPTEVFADLQLYLYPNASTGDNFIQLVNVPAISEDQSFQLWALKSGADPQPLDVFQADGEAILEVAFVPDAENYAITIEPRGGSQVPTLENLIGVTPVLGG